MLFKLFHGTLGKLAGIAYTLGTASLIASLLVAGTTTAGLASSGGYSGLTTGQSTCPQSPPWYKVNSNDLSQYPVAGAVAYCFKAGSDNVQGCEGGLFSERLNFGENGLCGLSHWAYKLGDPTAIPTSTNTPASSATDDPTVTPVSTDKFTATPTNTFTYTPSYTFTNTPTFTLTYTPTKTPTDTSTSPLTDTPTITNTTDPRLMPTRTYTPTDPATVTLTYTPANTATYTPANPPTNTPTNTPSDTPAIPPTDTPTITNTADPRLTPTETNTPSNTAATEPTSPPTETLVQPNLVDPKVDWLVQDNDGNTVPSPGDVIQYVMAITNNGGSAAEGVFFNDSPDNNTSLVVGSVTTTKGSIVTGNTAGDTSVAVDIGTIEANETVTITINVTINIGISATIANISNQGIITGSNIPDQNTDDPDTGDQDDPTDTFILHPRTRSTSQPSNPSDPGERNIAATAITVLIPVTGVERSVPPLRGLNPELFFNLGLGLLGFGLVLQGFSRRQLQRSRVQ